MKREEIENMQAGYEMNKLIAEFVFGMRLEKNHGLAGGFYWVGNGVHFGDMRMQSVPDYSTDIEAAWKVVEKMKENPDVGVALSDYHKGGFCFTFFGPGMFEYECDAETAPLAICKAALLAVMK